MILTVVIIDDSPIFVGLLIEFLERSRPPQAHVLASERDGQRGIDAVERLRPTLAIVDLIMPGMSGLEVIRRLRREHADLGVVALSSCDEVFAEAALSAGADAFVAKDRLRTDLPPALARATSARNALVTHALQAGDE